MINKAICADKKINNLSNDTSRLAFTWLVIHADKEGRTHGDPAMVRSMLFPRRDDVTVEQVESYITEWAVRGLIVRYESNDDLWIWFPNFEKNQLGLRKEREPDSIIPPLTEDCRIIDGTCTEDCLLKGREGKGISALNDSATPDVVLPGEAIDPPRTKPASKDNGRNKIRGDLEQYFAKISNTPLPKRETDGQRKAAAKRWWNPLADILEMTDWNLTQARSLVTMAYKQMKKDDLTISAPQSILSVAISLHADGRVGANGKRTIRV